MSEDFIDSISVSRPMFEIQIWGSYTVYQENRYFVKNMVLLKNPQFYPNHYKILWKWRTHEYLIFTKFRNDWVKIVDFLIKAYFWQSIDSPDTQCSNKTNPFKSFEKHQIISVIH